MEDPENFAIQKVGKLFLQQNDSCHTAGHELRLRLFARTFMGFPVLVFLINIAQPPLQ